MNQLRLAVVGAGHLGRIHARIASGNDDVELIAVADPIEAARNSVAEEVGIPAVSDYQTLLPLNSSPSLEQDTGEQGRGEANSLDAVIIASPTRTHHRIAADFLALGVPVLVEKPIAATHTEAADLVRLAREAGVPLQVGHVERYNPALVAATPHLANPKYIVAERLSGYPGRSLDVGVVLDLMIHDLDVILSLVQSPVRHVDALGISVLGGQEDMATARLVFESGCVANLTASRVSYERRRTMQVFTSKAFASIDFDTGKTELVEPADDVLSRQFDAPSLSPAEIADVQKNLFDEWLVRKPLTSPPVNAIDREQREFFHVVRSGGTPRVTGAAGRDALGVAEQILGAVASHAWDGDDGRSVGPLAMPTRPSLRPAA